MVCNHINYSGLLLKISVKCKIRTQTFITYVRVNILLTCGRHTCPRRLT